MCMYVHTYICTNRAPPVVLSQRFSNTSILILEHILLEAARSARKVWSVRERQHYIDQYMLSLSLRTRLAVEVSMGQSRAERERACTDRYSAVDLNLECYLQRLYCFLLSHLCKYVCRFPLQSTIYTNIEIFKGRYIQ